MNAIEIRNLNKNFKEKQAVSGLNMTVPLGAIYGFIGENGSGKSTTEKMICGLILPNGGTIKIFDKDYKDIDLDIDENDIKLVGEFKLINKKETLIGNGYDVQKKYTYQNNEGKTCTIMSKSVKFIPKEQLNNLILLDEPNTDGYKFINEDKKLVYQIGFNYGELQGNISSDELLKFFTGYYSKFY